VLTTEFRQALHTFTQRPLADDLDDLGNVQVVEQAIASQDHRVAQRQFLHGADFDAHVGGSDDVGNQVTILVVHGFLLVEHTCFDGETNR